MRQAIMISPGEIEFRDVPIPEKLESREVLLKIERIGVCGSDVHVFHGVHPATPYPVVPEERIIPIPDSMSLDQGALIEPAAVGAHSTSRSTGIKGKNVVVSGAGTIGNLVAQFAKARGAAKVLITDISDYRLGIARECGIEGVLSVAKTSFDEGVKTFQF